MRFDRAAVRAIRDRLQQALQPLGKELGMVIDVAGGSFTEANIVFKVEVATVGENGQVHNREAEDFKRMASLIGMKPEDLGREVAIIGRRYKIKGWLTKSKRYPILAESIPGGRDFKLPLHEVKLALGYKSTPPAPLFGRRDENFEVG